MTIQCPGLRLLKPETEYWFEGDDDIQRFGNWLTEVENDDVWGKPEQDFIRMIKRLRSVSARDGFFDFEKPDLEKVKNIT